MPRVLLRCPLVGRAGLLGSGRLPMVANQSASAVVNAATLSRFSRSALSIALPSNGSFSIQSPAKPVVIPRARMPGR